jgi:hypothetical protein
VTTPASTPDSVTILVLFALAALGASILIGGLLRLIWAKYEQRAIDRTWQARERLLDSRRTGAPSEEIFEWSPRLWRSDTRHVAQTEAMPRVLYIVARDQPELFEFLRRDFAAEEAEGVIEILMNRRHSVQSPGADGRDPRRNWSVNVALREMGFVLVRQEVPPHHTATEL